MTRPYWTHMRLSRPCYDKPHRCPGWAGGGMHFASRDRCASGRLTPLGGWDAPLRRWRPMTCDTCTVLVLPPITSTLDITWRIRSAYRSARYRLADRRQNSA